MSGLKVRVFVVVTVTASQANMVIVICMSGLKVLDRGGDGDLPVKQTWAQGGSWGSRPWWAQYSPWRTFQNESNDFDWDDGQSVIFYLGVIVMRVTTVRVKVMKIFGPPGPKTRWYWLCRPLRGLGSWFPRELCTCRSGRRLTCHDDNESLDVEKMFAHYYHSDFMKSSHRATALAKRSVRHAEHVGKRKTGKKYWS